MRKHLIATLLLMTGLPMAGSFTAMANPEPQQQSQAVTVIQGSVLDENNEPVIGASVSQKGTKGNAVATDAFGNFKIRVAPGATLEVSYVGYKTVNIAAAQGMTVYLQPTTEMLNELVAVGYGTQKRANLTGAVATVDVARVMDSRPVQDVTKALQGAVPGLTITNTDGGIASGSTINIRGLGTMSNSQTSNPLIIVDGVASDDLAYINPEDIQDISVLKDAASSSIYGSRAAFGVILITTKHANTKEKVKVTYSNNFAWSGATMYPHMALNSESIMASLQAYVRTGTAGQLKTEVSGMEYLKLLPYVQAWEKQHNNKGYTDYRELQPFESWDNVGDYAKDPDTGLWYHYGMWDVNKTVFSSAAPSSKHNVAVEGTSGKTQYRMNFGYDSKTGLYSVNPDHMHRYMANMTISTELFSFLKAGARINFSQRDYDDVWTNRYAYEYVWRWPSFEEGYGYIVDPETGVHYGTRNDLTDRLQSNPDVTRTRQTRLQAWMDATIIPGLILHGDFTYDIRNMRNSFTVPVHTYINWNWGTGATPYANLIDDRTQLNTFANKNNSESTRWTMNVYATYNKTFAQDHNLKVMVGANAEEYRYDYLSGQRYNMLDYSLPNLAQTDGLAYDKDGNPQYTHMTIGSSDSHYATAGFFGRINYDYKGIYLLEANGRYDGSSRFPAADQWAFFPSFSAGYRFSEENYFKPLHNWWSNGKLRASWGQVGNEAVGSYRFISLFSNPSNVNWVNGSGSGLIKGQGTPGLVSASLTWERIETTDVGLDLGFLNNSLNLSFDWYSRLTKDMLAPGADLPQTLGATAPYQNAGQLRTNGWELGVNWNHSFGDAQVYATASIGDARTKVTKWQNESLTLYSYRIGSGSNTNRLYEGQTYGDIWGMEFDRFFEESDFSGKDSKGNWVLKDGVPSQKDLQYGTFIFGPGDVKFKDLNGNGVIDCGTPDPGAGKRAAYIAEHPEAAQFLKYPNLSPDDPKQGWWPVASLHNHGDMKVIGNAMPRYEYSFRLGGSWKGFDIDLFFQGVGKRKFYMINNFVLMQAQGNGNPLYQHQIKEGYNKYIYDPNTFEITGYDIDQNNLYPVIYPGCFGYNTRYRQTLDQGINNFTTSDRYLTNMAYLRLKTATVGYTLPYDITKYALIERARIYFSCENPFFIYNGAGKFAIDPELSTSARGQASAAGVGAMGRTNPMMRSYSFGVQVTF